MLEYTHTSFKSAICLAFFYFSMITFLCAQQAITYKSTPSVETGQVNEVVAYEDGYFVMMSSEVAGVPDDLYVTKFDNCHEPLWSKSYSSNIPLDFNKALIDGDRLVILLGAESVNSSGLKYPILIFMTLDGLVISSRSYTDVIEINPNVISKSGDEYHLFGNSDQGPLQIIIDESGNVVSSNILGGGVTTGGLGSGFVPSFGSCILDDGSFIRRKENLLARISPAGDIIWAKFYQDLSDFGFSENEFITVPGAFILMMKPSSGSPALVKLDYDGNILWRSRGIPVLINSVSLELNDGRIILVSRTNDVASQLTYLEVEESTGDILTGVKFKFDDPQKYRFPELAISANGDVLISGSFLNNTPFIREDILQVNPQLSACHESIDLSYSQRPSIFSDEVNSSVYLIQTNVVEDVINLNATDEPFFFEVDCDLPIEIPVDTMLACQKDYLFEVSHPGATYLWSDGSTDSTRIFSGPESQTLAVEGCWHNLIYQVDITLDIQSLAADAGTDLVLSCDQPSLVLDIGNSTTGPDINYSWQTEDGNIVAGADTPNPEIDQAGSYILEVYNGTIDCGITDTVRVTNDVNFPVADAGPDQSLNCDVDMINLGANSSTGMDFTFSWIANGVDLISTDRTATVTQEGTFELVVTNTTNGCTERDTVIVSSDMESPTGMTVLNTPVDCLTGSLGVTDVQGGVEPYGFTLNGDLPQDIGDYGSLTPGSYVLNVTGANGCTYEETFNVAAASSFDLSLGQNVMISPGDSIQLTAITDLDLSETQSISWSPVDSLSCTDCLDPIAFPRQTTTYELTVTSTDGCTETATINVLVQLDPLKLFVPDVFSPTAGVGADKKFTIYSDLQVAQVNYLNIYDRWGGLVYSAENFPTNDEAFGWDGYRSDGRIESGVYVYSLELEMIDGTQEKDAGTLTLLH